MHGEPHITQRTPQPTAGLRRTVAMAELTGFFSEAFSSTAAQLQAQGLHPAGPPFGKYYGTPGATVDLEAGFPVNGDFRPAGDIQPGVLPGGRAVEMVHEGPYDTMETSYATIGAFLAERGLAPDAVMWESYLDGPDSGREPSHWQTLLVWPVAEHGTGATVPDSD